MPIEIDRPDGGSGGRPKDENEEKDRWAWADVVEELIIPVVWTRWVTREDERVCPECGPLDGLVWTEETGPSPPLHVNCRCARIYAFTTFRVRG